MNNTLEGINRRITETEEWINDLGDRMVEITAIEQNTEKRMERSEDSLRDLWDNIKCTNIHITEVPEEKTREKGPEKIFEEMMVENLLNVCKKIIHKVRKAQSPRKDKHKEEHTETHSNQIDKN